ncbi:MAG TPA: serine hydrolase [Thermomicrobiales bacterium]|nr:serine hydrolase [Thermomicrobiales bacterium]
MATTPTTGEDLERRDPAELGFDPERLDAAIAFIKDHEARGDHHTRVALDLPDNDIVGPLKDRGGHNGMILRHGAVAAEWGDTQRVDMTYSISKSYLSTVAGLAFDRGMIRDLDERVSVLVPTDHFSSEHNGQITWRHLLRQTSEWTGALWGKRDLADRRKGVDRELNAPGTFYEYNDVRVNLLSFALMQLWRRALPEVLKEYVMDPIVASAIWQRHGYSTSWEEIDGQRIQGVSGGGHFGGGVWIATPDHARFGQLFLQRGRWGDRQILSERWIDEATTPGDIEPTYGFMWWLNPDHLLFPSLPANSFAARGAGSNIIWISPDHDLVVVLRWVDGESMGACLAQVLGAVE